MTAGVLFDVDGTLVDTNYLHTLAWSRAFADVGEWAPMNAIHRLIGMGGDKVLPAVTGLQDDDALAKQIVAARSELFMRDFLPRVRAFPQARALVERILACGQRPVVASSANDRELSGLLEEDGALFLRYRFAG